MAREVERSAPSVEEAVEAALDELGVSEQEAEIEILQEAQRGLLGFGAHEAKVRVRVRTEPIAGAALDEQAEAAEEFLSGLLDRMGVDADLDHDVVDGTMYVDILAAEGAEDVGILIGKHGHTLDALQELVRAAVQRRTRERCLVLVDVEDYRKRRRSQLVHRARQAAQRVKRSGKPERLEPMTPYERKVVHDAVAGVAGVESASEGEEPDRRVLIRRRR